MKFPTIDQYIDALKNSKLFINSIPPFYLARKKDGEPNFHSGNFGIVFKAILANGESYALKCFTRNQWGRREAYARFKDWLPESEYLVPAQYMKGEIAIAPYGDIILIPFDLVAMDYINGVTLSEKLHEAALAEDISTLQILSENFDIMALWLLDQDFAHGDIKPDNIIVQSDLSFKLIDYDGIYIQDMVGETQREFGAKAFQHPLREQMLFNKHIDDYSIAILSLTLRAIAADFEIYERFCGNASELLISPFDAVYGRCAALDYIELCGFVDQRLIDIVSSPVAAVEELRDIILSSFNPQCVERVHVTYDEGLSPVNIDDKWGYEDSCGDIVIEPQWDLTTEFSCGIASVKKGKRWAYITEGGALLSRFIFDYAGEFTCDGLALIRRGGKYGYASRDGRVAISARYDYGGAFSEGYAVVAIDGRYGYIDTRSKWVVAPQYDFARPVRNGISRVELQGKEFDIEVTSGSKKKLSV